MARSAASVAMTTTSLYVLSERLKRQEGLKKKGRNKKKSGSSYNKQHHFDVALKGKQMRRLQEAS